MSPRNSAGLQRPDVDPGRDRPRSREADNRIDSRKQWTMNRFRAWRFSTWQCCPWCRSGGFGFRCSAGDPFCAAQSKCKEPDGPGAAGAAAAPGRPGHGGGQQGGIACGVDLEHSKLGSHRHLAEGQLEVMQHVINVDG